MTADVAKPEDPLSTPPNQSDTGTDKTISVSAVILRDSAGRWLTVRKRGTSSFMHPGGKPEPGEDPRRAALREVAEELRLSLDPDTLDYLGAVDTDAANEPGHSLHAEVFLAPCPEEPGPAAEIEEVRWLDPTALTGRRVATLAPLLYDCAERWPNL